MTQELAALRPLAGGGITESVDEETQVLKRRLGPKEPGVHRAVWDLNWAAPS